MKNILFLLTVSLILTSCKPEIKGELGEPFSKIEGMNGNWKLSSFSQRDENNPIKEIRDLSDFYIVAGEEVTLFNFQSSDFTYTVVPGTGRNYFGTSGTWRFDNNDAPAYLYLENESDTLEIKLGSMPHTFDNQLSLELPRYCYDSNGIPTPTVSYIFTIQRAN